MEREDEIRQIAYYIWQQDGCCEGHDIEYWCKAEVIWLEKQKAAATKQPQPDAEKKSKETPLPEKTPAKPQPAAGKKQATDVNYR